MQHRNTTSRKRHKQKSLEWASVSAAHSRDFETKEEQALALLFPRTKAMMHAGRQAGVEELVYILQASRRQAFRPGDHHRLALGL